MHFLTNRKFLAFPRKMLMSSSNAAGIDEDLAISESDDEYSPSDAAAKTEQIESNDMQTIQNIHNQLLLMTNFFLTWQNNVCGVS